MRALLQRVGHASVTGDGKVVGQIGQGLLGVGQGDSEVQVKSLAEKIVYLRIFGDEEGKMNRSLLDIGGEVLVVSQFTLYADVRLRQSQKLSLSISRKFLLAMGLLSQVGYLVLL